MLERLMYEYECLCWNSETCTCMEGVTWVGVFEPQDVYRGSVVWKNQSNNQSWEQNGDKGRL